MDVFLRVSSPILFFAPRFFQGGGGGDPFLSGAVVSFLPVGPSQSVKGFTAVWCGGGSLSRFRKDKRSGELSQLTVLVEIFFFSSTRGVK